MELADFMILCLLLHGPHHAKSQENTTIAKEPDRGPLDPNLKEVKPLIASEQQAVADTVDLATPGETTNLRWMTAEKRGDKQTIPLNAFSIYNSYTSRKEYVCRPRDTCALGFMTEARGFYCYYSLRGHQLLTNNFQFLQNRKNFELLEWKSGQNGSVPKYSIKNCEHNFVGRNKYGLGNVHSLMKVFYLPWEGKEYWYEEYEVLTVNRNPYHLHVFQISYDTKKVNISTHPSEELMESICMNNNNNSKEIVKDVYMQTKHVKENTWEPSLSMPHMLSTNFSVKIPEIALGRGNGSRLGSVAVWSGYKFRENVTLTLHHTTVIPPGLCCKVKMLGKKTEVTMPFWAQVTKIYLNGTTHKAAVVGVYKSKEMGGITGEAGACVPVETKNVTAERNQPDKTIKPTGAVSTLSTGLGSYAILALSLTAFRVAVY